MQVITRYTQPAPVAETIEIPDGEGREDCSCGAVVKEASKPEYDHAVATHQRACIHCQTLFPNPESGTTLPTSGFGQPVPGIGQPVEAPKMAESAELIIHPEPAAA